MRPEKREPKPDPRQFSSSLLGQAPEGRVSPEGEGREETVCNSGTALAAVHSFMLWAAELCPGGRGCSVILGAITGFPVALLTR